MSPAFDSTEPRILDLDARGWAAWSGREDEIVPDPHALTIGVATKSLPSASRALLERLTLTLGPGPSPHCVGSADDLDDVTRTIAANSSAAHTLAQVLAATSTLPVESGLVVESLAYSMLLGSAEFARWRANTRRRELPVLSDPVLLERSAWRLDVVLDNPSRHNAFSSAMRDAVLAGLEIAVLDTTITEVVLRGHGPTFCSGGDLDEFGTATDPAIAHQVRTTASVARLLHQLGARARVEVHGTCIGAGVELPAFAARVDASPNATFRLPELAMGLIPGAGGTISLPRRIGRWRTAWLALTGRAIDAATARSWGLVDGYL